MWVCFVVEPFAKAGAAPLCCGPHLLPPAPPLPAADPTSCRLPRRSMDAARARSACTSDGRSAS
eukprot:4910075-Prymnesium_polylepis.1